VTDENDLNDTYTEDDVTVAEYTQAGPAANFGYSVNFLEVTFTDISVEGDGAILIWAWDFGDDSTSTEQNPVHTYLRRGNYFVTLVVTDENGMIDEGIEFIIVATDELLLPVNYPNPFKENTTIIFEISIPSIVKIDVFNLLGEKVYSLIPTYVNEEVNRVVWDGKNNRGKLVRSGLYFYRIQTDNDIQTGKMVVIR
jgi:PKD repeat protein